MVAFSGQNNPVVCEVSKSNVGHWLGMAPAQELEYNLANGLQTS